MSTPEEFVTRYGSLYEHSPWLAERVWQNSPGLREDFETLLSQFQHCFLAASTEEQRQVVLAHPDLAGKLAQAGDLTSDSTSEQASAGLDQCNAAELAEFQSLNQRYREKFQMPYILAVRGRSRLQILENFRQRVQHTPEQEWPITLEQINRIAQLRLEQLFDHDPT